MVQKTLTTERVNFFANNKKKTVICTKHPNMKEYEALVLDIYDKDATQD